jgi:hypothetical protein
MVLMFCDGGRVMTDGRVNRAISQRVAMLAMSNPELTTEWAIIDNDWGLITISSGSRLVGYEYVESGSSWARAGRLRVYEETMRRGLSALIIVPEEAYMPLRMRLITNLGPHQPVVLSYDSMGITLTPRSS